MKKMQLTVLRSLALAMFGGVILTFSSCSNNDLVQDETKSTAVEKKEGLTTFIAELPATEKAGTRTTVDYATGKYTWSKGDKIFVLDDDNVWQQSTNGVEGQNSLDDAKVSTFNFQVPGKFAAKTSYQVLYLGKNATSGKVTISATQKQTNPNQTLHLGEAGDWGIATANKTGAGAYYFRLNHKSTILAFQPFNSATSLQSCVIQKIVVTSDNDIAGTYTVDTTTGQLKNDGSGKEIELTTQRELFPGFPLPDSGFPVNNTSASVTNNGAFVVIKPGTHKLTVQFHVYDRTTNVPVVITKKFKSFTYAENNIYDMKVDLKILNFDANYYMWDAQQNYWYQHEWGTSDVWQPTESGAVYGAPSAGTYNANYPKSKATDANRWYNDSYAGDGVSNSAQTATFKQLPNANELAWYCVHGDPHADKLKVYSIFGHLRQGGMWFKKKEHIAGFSAERAPSGEDLRTVVPTADDQEYAQNTNPSKIPPADNVLKNYFFLPALGWYQDGRLANVGYNGYYWSSTARAKNNIAGDHAQYAFNLFFKSDNTFGYTVYVESSNRKFGFRTHRFE